MFTGLVQSLGKLIRVEATSGDSRLWFEMGSLKTESLAIGDSIAINGACLTIVAIQSGHCAFDASRETLSLTALNQLKPGDAVNMEPALTLSQPLGGHLVSGHVDGIALVTQMTQDARSWRIRLKSPEGLSRYIAPKGSVTLDGVSLTVNEVCGVEFSVNIIPHTFQATTIQHWSLGRGINLEVDLIARYVESLLGAHGQSQPESGGVNEALLRRTGFLS